MSPFLHFLMALNYQCLCAHFSPEARVYLTAVEHLHTKDLLTLALHKLPFMLIHCVQVHQIE